MKGQISSTRIIEETQKVINKLKNIKTSNYTQEEYTNDILNLANLKLNNEIVYEYNSDNLIVATLSREMHDLMKEHQKEWRKGSFFGLKQSNSKLKLNFSNV